MSLIQLSCNCYVDAEDISEIIVSDYGHITVRMKSGVGHSVNKDYGKSQYQTVDRLVKEINDAKEQYRYETPWRDPVNASYDGG